MKKKVFVSCACALHCLLNSQQIAGLKVNCSFNANSQCHPELLMSFSAHIEPLALLLCVVFEVELFMNSFD